MKADGFLSLKDYFNFYLSGFIWLLDFTIIVAMVSYDSVLGELVSELGDALIDLGIVANGVLFLLLPYIIGFVLFPLNQYTRILWQGKNRKWRPSPQKWLLLRSEDLEEDKKQEKHKPNLKGSRFSKKETQILLNLVENRFGLKYKTSYNLIFFPVRTYLLEHGNEAAKHAIRLRDLMSLSESFLVPVPLFLGLLPVLSLDSYWQLIGIPLALFFEILLVKRYHRTEIDWVKRVYRGFLALESRNNS